MCPVGLLGVVRSRQVHQLKQAHTLGVVCQRYLILQISPAEPHFKATRWFIDKLLKLNTAN